VARYLGPSDMGRQSYIAFVSTVATIIAGFGLPVALQRYVATAAGSGQPTRVAALAVLGWRASVVCALLAFLSVAAVGAVTYPDLRAAWLLAAGVSALAVVQSTASNVLFGLQQFRRATLIGLVLGLVGVAAAIGALAVGWGITGMFAAELGTNLVITAGTFWLSVVAVRPDLARRDPLGPLRGELLRFAVVIGVGLIIEVVVFKRSEFIFLERFSTSQQIAFYSVAFAAVTAAGRLPTAVVQLVLPAVSTLAGADQHDRITAGFGRGMRLMLTFSLPVAAFSIALGPIAIRAVYGHDYADAGLVLALIAPVPLVVGPLTAMSSATLNALGQLRSPLLWGFAALAVTIALDFIVIPPWGAVGAAVANDGGQLSGSLPIIYLAQRHVRARWIRSVLVRPLVLSAIAAAGAWAAAAAMESVAGSWAGLATGSGVALALFFGLASVTKMLDAEDTSWLVDALGPKAKRAVGVIERLGRSPA
jgi:O-antigen/teichoic acid export membrane protein